MTLPPPTTLPSLSPSSFTSILSLLFEPSPPLHDLILTSPIRTTPYATYPALITAITSLLSTLDSSDPTTLLKILSAHPRLGAKKVESAQSAAEQKSLQGSEEEAARLRALNQQYEERFPGLRYVVFVNGRDRDTVMKDMERRIEGGDFEAEKKAAIEAMRDIAIDRAAKLQAKD